MAIGMWMTSGATEGAATSRRLRAGRWRWLAGAPWLIFLSQPVAATLDRNDPPLAWLGVAGLVLFATTYLLSVPLLASCRTGDLWRRGVPLLMFLLATALLPLSGEDGLVAYVFVAVIAVFMLAPRAALACVTGLMAVAAGLGTTVPGWTEDPLDPVLSIATAAGAMFGLVSVIRRNRELLQAREELARLAVDEERLRFARDLHDVLGHSLTVITVKAELAGRLLSSGSPATAARAAGEVGDIEQLARGALADVRATVAGYREVNLAAEIAAARVALDAAGIRADLPGALDAVPAGHRELFGWVVREGVTNVVRHSGARTCRVRVTADAVEVVDDGRGPGAQLGTGLSGLRHRIERAGGQLDTGPAPDGGFRLRAAVPV